MTTEPLSAGGTLPAASTDPLHTGRTVPSEAGEPSSGSNRRPAADPTGSLDDILAAGLRITAYSAWHDEHLAEKTTGRWCWHASQLAGCPRAAILRRAGYTMDPPERDMAMLLQQAQMIHQWMEFCVRAYAAANPEHCQLMVVEEGYRHPGLHLAAKPDALVRIDGRPVLFDWKTEKEGAVEHRRRAAQSAGMTTNVRPEHALQLTATAMTLEANGVDPIAEGRIGYLSRQEWWTEECAVDVQSPELRAQVEQRVHGLDKLWREYKNEAILPKRYPRGHWNCRPRPQEPSKGKYCDAFRSCMDRRMPA